LGHSTTVGRPSRRAASSPISVTLSGGGLTSVPGENGAQRV